MKRFLNLFVLTTAEQRLVIVLILLVVAGAWFKHHRDASFRPLPAPNTTPSASASPDER